MKLRALIVCFAWASTLAAAVAAEVGIEFSGVLAGDKDVHVALTKTATGTTRWVPVGSGFEGYIVSSYDAKASTVTLAKDGQSVRLALKQGKTAPAAASKPPEQVERAVLNNLRQLAAAADQYYLENGKSTANYDDLVGPTKYVKQLNVVDGENYRAIQFAQGKTLRVTTNSGGAVSYDP